MTERGTTHTHTEKMHFRREVLLSKLSKATHKVWIDKVWVHRQSQEANEIRLRERERERERERRERLVWEIVVKELSTSWLRD